MTLHVDSSREFIEAAGYDTSRFVAFYSEPQRVYHGLEHIEQMLKTLGQMTNVYGFSKHTQLKLHLAAWYHDIVYEIGSKFNEERSADLASAETGMLDVRKAILTTKDHKNPRTFWGACLLDADLLGLGGSAKVYEDNRVKVKAEYGPGLTEEMWTAGRTAFLESYLGRPTLYHTSFAAPYEQVARDNMERELDSLK